MVIKTLVVALSSVLLAGCVTVGPDYNAPVQAPVTLQGAGAPVYAF